MNKNYDDREDPFLSTKIEPDIDYVKENLKLENAKKVNDIMSGNQ